VKLRDKKEQVEEVARLKRETGVRADRVGKLGRSRYIGSKHSQGPHFLDKTETMSFTGRPNSVDGEQRRGKERGIIVN